MTQTTTAIAADYEHETACGLIDPESMVSMDFIEVFEALQSHTDLHVDWGAAGCGTCFHTDADIGVYWVAQRNAVDRMHVNYGSTADELTTEDVGHLLGEVAADLDVPYSWDGDTNHTFVLGDADYYDEEDTEEGASDD